MTSPREVDEELAELAEPSVMIARLFGVLPTDVLDDVALMELDSGDTLAMLWSALLDAGLSAENILREKGVIE